MSNAISKIALRYNKLLKKADADSYRLAYEFSNNFASNDSEALMALAVGIMHNLTELEAEFQKNPELYEQYKNLLERKAEILNNCATQLQPLDQEGQDILNDLFE